MALPMIGLLFGRGDAYQRRVLEGISRQAAIHPRCHLVGRFIGRYHDWGRIPLDGMDGFLTCLAHDHPAVPILHRLKRPVVNCFRDHDPQPFPLVTADDQAIGRLLAAHASTGKFGEVAACGTHDFPFWNVRRESLRAGLAARVGWQEHKLPDSDRLDGEAMEDLGRWLVALPRPCLVVAGHDLIGGTVLEQCHRLGIPVPEGIAVVGADDDPTAALTAPALSSVDVAADLVGERMLVLLLDLLRGDPAPLEPILVPPRGLIVRRSSDLVVGRDPLLAQAWRYLQDHALEGIGVDTIASEVGVSRRTLERRFAEAFGISPLRKLNQIRLERALWLLRHSDLTIKDVARACGFSFEAGTSHFARFIRRGAGLRPQDLRAAALASRR